jgi:hypothetical protein
MHKNQGETYACHPDAKFCPDHDNYNIEGSLDMDLDGIEILRKVSVKAWTGGNVMSIPA